MRILAILLAAAAASTLNRTPSPAMAAAPAPASAEAEVRLPHISIVKRGHGPAVVLLPGLASPRGVWDGVAPDLARDHTVYLVQVNGFAGDDPGANLGAGLLQGIVADLNAYLANEKAGPTLFIGHSMGGLTAVLFAKTHPDQVRRLMIVDALPFFPVLMDPNATVDQARPIAAMMRDRVLATYGKPADPAVVEANVKGLALKPESLVRMKAWAAAADPRVTAGALYDDMTTDARPLLPTIKAPIIVVVPWSDSAFGRERTLAFYSRQYAGALNVRYADIGDAGHFVMLDQPARFAEEVKRFVAE
jgi:pimeloyl-ACP methyl ester carboxylesterase